MQNANSSRPIDVVAIGQASRDIIYQRGERVEDAVGGPALYVAVMSEALGLHAGIVTRVGTDYHADVEELLFSTGVDTMGLHVAQGVSTTIELWYDGEHLQEVRVSEGVGALLSARDVPGDYMSARIGLIAPGPYDAQVAIARALKSRQITVSFDPHADFNEMPFSHTAAVLSHVDLFFANAAETLQLTGVRDIESAAAQIHEAGVQTVVVTQGSLGAIIFTENDRYDIPAIPPKRVVDVVGAGEAFKAGFFLGLCRQLEPNECGILGAAAASCSLESIGLRSLPTRPMITERIRSLGIEFGDLGE